jgi:acyl transferase domain-containing protein
MQESRMTTETGHAETVLRLLERGALTAEAAEALLAATPRQSPAKVAVLGAALRLPGADTVQDMWRLLQGASPVIAPFPAQRFDLVVGANERIASEHRHERSALGTDPRSFGAWLEGIEQFEPEAFGLTAFEAELLGPAERLLLQITDEALVVSGYRREELTGTRTGVFLAYQPPEHFTYLRLFDDPDERSFISNIPANAAYRLAYMYDWHGPVMNVDTTCSSSLTCLHLARQSLRLGECDLAIVAGLSLDLYPFWNDASDHFVCSPRYRCNAYDAQADGIVWGEGAVAVVLKRADEAVREGNCISALITGSSLGSDGASNGMEAPNPDGHFRVVRQALAEAGVSAREIGYVEGHGTGTRLGDVVEVDALSRAFRVDTAESGFCQLGSFKTITGHLGDAAGLAGFVAAMLRVQHGILPALAGLREPNPAIGWADSPFRVSGRSQPWPLPAGGGPRRAGVSSLGLSGTNVHVILEEHLPESSEPGPAAPVLISAPSRWALWGLVRRLAETSLASVAIADVAHTLARRKPGPYRVAVMATDTAALATRLDQLLAVRAFDRVPDNFYEQGIFVADSDETSAASLDRLHAGAGGHITAPDRELIADFLAFGAVEGPYRERTERGRVVALPTAPFTTRRIWPSASVGDEADVSDLFFDAQWEPVLPAARTAPIGGSVLLLARESDPVAEAIRARLTADGADVVVAWCGNRFARRGPAEFEISPAEESDYARLWASLGENWVRRLDAIVHDVAGSDTDDGMSDLEALERTQADGVYSLFNLARSLVRLTTTRPLTLAVVAARAHEVIPQEPYAPARVTSFGFIRVLSQEIPNVAELAIDHDLSGDAATVADQIVDELALDSRARLPLLAYRNGTRYVRTVDRLAEGDGEAIPIRPGGVYVIVGGTGYLGPEVAAFLGDHGAGTVVLLSRAGLPPRAEWDLLAADPHFEVGAKIRAIQRVEQSGTRIEARICDITDPAAVRDVFAEIAAEIGPVNGGFMLAKELYHLWIADLDFDRFRKAIHNRVRGTWLLARALEAQQADFLVLFSSVSSMIGTKGASECSAVNQYLDAVGPYLTRRGLQTHTLNLTLVLDDKSSFAAKTPIPPIDFAAFRAALERFFRDGRRFEMVAALDLEEIHYLRPVLRIPFAERIWCEAAAAAADRTGTVQVSAAPEVAVTPEELEQDLIDVWKMTLGLAQPPADQSFFAAGGTSLSAIRFVHLFGKARPGVQFDIADLYAYPTFGRQLGFLQAQLSPGTAAGNDATQADLDQILERVERGELSGEAAAGLLLSNPAPPKGQQS